MEYIHLYETEQQFNAEYDGSEYKEPWLSYTESEDEVNYNKKSN